MHQWKYVYHLLCGHFHHISYFGHSLQLSHHLLGERSLVNGINGAVAVNFHPQHFHTISHVGIVDGDIVSVVDAHPHFLPQFVGNLSAGSLYEVVILHVFGLIQSLSVDIHDVVLNLEAVAGQTHAALHIVLAAVDRTVNDIAEHLFVGPHRSASILVDEGVVVGVLHFQRHSVAGREIEHHNIVTLHIPEAFQALIIPLRIVDIRLAVDIRDCVLCKREMDWSVWHTRAVNHLVHPQIVAHKQRFLERG